MESPKTRQYISAVIGALILIVFGTVVVLNRSGFTSVQNSGGLNIDGVILGTNSAQPIPVAPPPVRPGAVNAPYTHINATTSTSSTKTTDNSEDNTFFDWNSFITALSHPPKTTGTSSTSNVASDAYSFIPSSLFSPPQPQKTLELSDSQKELYGWGDSAGGAILSFEGGHPNQPQILKDFIEDRQNTAKISAMKKLGADLSTVGDDIANIDPVPAQMKTAAPALADAYREIGRNLAAIPDAQGDDATVKAILAYDKSADAFVGKFVNVVNILQANGVKYTQDEPGGVFMFPSQ